MNKYQQALKELMKSSSELKSLIEWFLAENNIDSDKITAKDVKELITKLKDEEELDESKFSSLVSKMK